MLFHNGAPLYIWENVLSNYFIIELLNLLFVPTRMVQLLLSIGETKDYYNNSNNFIYQLLIQSAAKKSSTSKSLEH
jgi:hypothetical protein